MLVDAVRNSPNYAHTLDEGYETLEKHWTSLLAAHHPIFCVERESKS